MGYYIMQLIPFFCWNNFLMLQPSAVEESLLTIPFTQLSLWHFGEILYKKRKIMRVKRHEEEEGQRQVICREM